MIIKRSEKVELIPITNCNNSRSIDEDENNTCRSQVNEAACKFSHESASERERKRGKEGSDDEEDRSKV